MMHTHSLRTSTNSALVAPPAPVTRRFHTPDRPKAIVLAAKGADSLSAVQRRMLEQTATVEYVAVLSPLAVPDFVQLVHDFDYIAITRRAITQIDRSVIDALPRLKGLSVYSTGVEWIDLDYLQFKEIRWTALPDYCTNAVAESALGLMLMVAHKLHLRYQKSIHVIPEQVSLRGFELSSSVVGILGYGKIGKLLARKIQPLCRQVLAHDIDPHVFNEKSTDVQQADKGTILSKSRFVIVCAAQQYREQQLLCDGDYDLMGPETVVVNVARTSLLDHQRLIRMVRQKRIHAYVYDDLMPREEDPNVTEYGKIIPTGHTAWYTGEAILNGSQAWVDNLISLCLTTS